MRKTTLACLAAALLAAPAALTAQQAAPPAAPAQAPDIPRDMRPYQVVVLVKGARWTAEQNPRSQALLFQHLAYIRGRIEEGAYRTAGPLMGGGDAQGIIILAAASPDEALRIVRADPAVQAGHFDVQVHPAMLPSLDGVQVRY